jgi:hypothetical protein
LNPPAFRKSVQKSSEEARPLLRESTAGQRATLFCRVLMRQGLARRPPQGAFDQRRPGVATVPLQAKASRSEVKTTEPVPTS